MIFTNNKSINFDYQIIEKFEAGIVLKGNEVKSIQNKNVNLKGSYISLQNNEFYLKNCHISPYKFSSTASYNPTIERKLLLKKSEIIKLSTFLKEKGHQILPLNFHRSGRKIKLDIAICKHKKEFDKRNILKKKSAILEIKRALKKY